MSWITRLFGGCDHKWDLFRTYKVLAIDGQTQVATQYHQRCEKCGEIRVRTL